MDADSLLATVEFKDTLEELTGRKKKDDASECFPKLTLKQRLMGFMVCCGLGLLLDLLAFLMMVFSMGKGRMIRFGVFYSIGNLISLFGTAFLVGPVRQFKNMKDPARLITTIIFMVSLVGTLVVAFTVQNDHLQRLLILVFILAQSISYFWYSLSYIPCGQSVFKKCCEQCFGE